MNPFQNVPQLGGNPAVLNQPGNFIPPTLTLDNLTPEQLGVIKGRLQDLLLWRETDSFRLDAQGNLGTTPTEEIKLFTVPIGGTTSVANNSALTYKKKLSDTTMESELLPRGRTFFVQSIQIRPTNVSSYAAYPFPPGNDGVILPASSNTNPIGYVQNAAVAMEQLMTQGHLKFTVGEKDYERGQLILFPSRYGVSGVSGAGGFGEKDVESAIYNNGFGKPVLLPIARTISAGRNFSVSIKWDHELQLLNNVRFDVILEGLMLRSVQ